MKFKKGQLKNAYQNVATIADCRCFMHAWP